jgi:hypothetical protein
MTLVLVIIVAVALFVTYKLNKTKSAETVIQAPEKIEPVAEEAAEKPAKKVKATQKASKKPQK